jgi:SAM-dependent methyltransferase
MAKEKYSIADTILGAAVHIRKSAFQKAVSHFQKNGPVETAKEIIFAVLRRHARVRNRRMGLSFDEENGVQTSGRIWLSDLVIDEADTSQSMAYEPAPTTIIADVCRKLQPDYGDFTFIDLGSGKGRVVLLASHLEFKKVIGVEFSEELHREAVHNLTCYPKHKRRSLSVELVCEDVRTFEFPEDKLIVFIFDAFKADLLRHIIERLRTSYIALPRKMYIVYLNPDPRNEPIAIMEASKFLYRLEVFGFLDKIRYYTNSPLHVAVYATV